MAIRNIEFWQKRIRWSCSLSLISLCCLIGGHQTATADVIPNESWRTQSTRVTTNEMINDEVIDYVIRGGIEQGNTVFHLFEKFNVPTGEKAYFDPSAGIDRVFGSITGDMPSVIEGVVGVTSPANLSLFNRRGFHLGRDASFDLPESSLFLGTGEGFYAEESLQGNFLKVTLAPPTISPESVIISDAHLSVDGNLSLEAAFLKLRGSLEAGENINLTGFDVWLWDGMEEPTIVDAGQGLTIQGDRINILLDKHPDSGILADEFVSLFGSESIGIRGRIEVDTDDSFNELPPWIAIESIDFDASILEIFASKVGAEAIAANVEILAIEDSQFFANDAERANLGEIGITTQAGSFERTSLILNTLKGSIKITGNFIIFVDSQIFNLSLQSNENPKISLEALSLIAENSQFAVSVPNDSDVGDIKFDSDRIVLDETNIIAPGDIDIITQTIFSSPDTLIQSESGEVNVVEILPTPILPPVSKAPEIPSPPLPVSTLIFDDAEIGEPTAPLEVDFEGSESQFGDPEPTTIAMDNRCADSAGNDLFEVKPRSSVPYDPTTIIFEPIRSQGLEKSHTPNTASHNPREATESFLLTDGSVFFGRRCSAAASHERRFFS
ncbi:MAG: filamentous hemagglutinin N-terminal domain-containing protein [Cyanobacteria bacterium P01_E01_bin.42]